MVTHPMELAGRRIIVTGASSGIGREVAVLLGELNARVVLVGRNEANLEATRSKLNGEGHCIALFDFNLLDEIPKWLKGLAERFGPFDGLVHSAGIHAPVPLRVLSPKKLQDVMRINVEAAIMLAKGFRQQGCCGPAASIVFLSSVMGLVGEQGVSAYAASKAALCGATRSLALELAREGIRVNSIAAGMVETEMTERFRAASLPERFAEIEGLHPLGFGKPRDVAYGVAFLLADTARWITGSTLVIDGGYTAR